MGDNGLYEGEGLHDLPGLRILQQVRNIFRQVPSRSVKYSLETAARLLTKLSGPHSVEALSSLTYKAVDALTGPSGFPRMAHVWPKLSG